MTRGPLALMAALTMALALVLSQASAVAGSPLSGSGLRYDSKPCNLPASVTPTGGDTWIYVSAGTGNDANPGTLAAPIQTLAHAQSLVRSSASNMNGNIVVCIEPDTYRLSSPLEFAPQDSGTNGFKVVYTSSASTPAVVSGASKITGWKLKDTSKNIWEAPVPSGLRTRQIYVNGMRAGLASGAVRGTVIQTSKGYKMYPDPMAMWPDASRVDFGYIAALGLWTNVYCPVAKVRGAEVTMAEPCWKNSVNRANNFVGWGNLTRPSFMEDAYELLGKPGQFFIDYRKNRLYYVPRAGQDMSSADVEAPFLQSLVTGTGTPTSPVHDLVFSNLEFAYATWMRPSTPEGLAEIQSTYSYTGPGASKTQGLCQYAHGGTCPYGAWAQAPGNVEFSYDRNLAFLNDRFVHLGAAALDLNDGSQNVTVSQSVFTDISGNGIEVGNVDLPKAAAASQTANVTVEDNYLYGFPVEYQGGCPIIVGYAANTLITHNDVEDVPYSGISIGWGGWPDKYGHPPVPNFSHDNTISDNIVANFMQLLSDGGGIYTQGTTGNSWATGEHVTGNIVHDELDWSRALQSDDGATWDTYSSNVLYNNDYDWGTNHWDYGSGKRHYDPTLLQGNYWQQGDPNTNHRMFIESGNTVISGPGQVPSSVLSNAGIEPQYASLLSWQPSTGAVPNAPQRLDALYAFGHTVYLTWRPGFAYGSGPATSYSVQTCLFDSASYSGWCGKPIGQPLVVSASDFNQLGYVVIPGLKTGTTYSFTVTENNAYGGSTPSIASLPIQPVNASPHLPGHPNHLLVRAGVRAASVQWYAPSSAKAWYYKFATQPILAYDVTVSDAGGVVQQLTSTSLAQAITTNGGSKTVFMVSNLTPGVKYQFAVQAVTPTGAGIPAVSGWVTPLANTNRG